MLFTFVGCSGVGKNTIIKDLLLKHPDLYRLLPTVTTRKMREGESEGNPYHFVSKDDFVSMIETGEIYEYQQIHENFYGGSYRVLNAAMQETGKSFLKDIDVLGSNTLKEKFKDFLPVISLFMYVNDKEILLNRLRERGETPDTIELRSKRFDMEMSLSNTGDYLINNIVREDTAALIDKIITCENEKTAYGISEKCELPTEEEVQALTKEAEAGALLARVEMGFNGMEILILDGADRYAAALKAGAFVQKHFVNALDESLTANKNNDAWKKLIK